jgi:hypothetical protein
LKTSLEPLQYVTVSGNPYAAFNKKWFVKSVDCLGLNIAEFAQGAGSGGTGKVIADSYYHEGQSQLMIPGSSPELIFTGIMWAAAEGMAGTRAYNYAADLNEIVGGRYFDGEPAAGIQPGSSPRYNGADSIARWHAMSNGYNLVASVEPYLLEPKLHSPDYGPTMVSAARTSVWHDAAHGELLGSSCNRDSRSH